MIKIETVPIPRSHGRKPRSRRHGPVIKGDSGTIPGRIGLARVAKGLTQKQLAGKIGKSRATAIQYEQGRLTPPVKVFKTLADVLEVSPEWLAFGRQAVDGLDSAFAGVTMISEVNDEEEVVGAYAFPNALIADLGTGPDTKVLKITRPAPAFGLKFGDRIIFDPADELHPDAEDLYLIVARSGTEIVRIASFMALDTGEPYGSVDVTDPRGIRRTMLSRKLTIKGRVIGSIRREWTD